jgi:hypothetical protein
MVTEMEMVTQQMAKSQENMLKTIEFKTIIKLLQRN